MNTLLFLFMNRDFIDNAKWMGILYQPDSWIEINPDPALIVEWKVLPKEYYCLAVWGGDKAQIEEFID